MKADEFKEFRAKQPKLFHYFYAFNFNPAAYLHPSRRSDFFSTKISETIWTEPRVQPHLSDIILEKLNLNKQICLQYPHPKWSLALLSITRMARLATHIGAIALGSKVRGSIGRDQVVAWKEKLGDDAYQFVVNSGRLLPTYPRLADEKLTANVQTIGYSLIAKSLIDAPASMSVRALLKLPATLPDLIDESINADQIVQNVLTILEAEWHSLFVAKNH
jgi:hypothetical protein